MKKNKKAFTLVELLVVISIIALLMAIMMPSLARVKNQAQALVCRNTLRQWGLFFDFYLQSSNGVFFRTMHTANPANGGNGTWMTPMRTYFMENPDMWCCPTATIPATNEDGVGTGIDGPFKAWGTMTDVWGAFSSNDSCYGKVKGSYGTNGFITDVQDAGQTYQGILGSDFWRNVNVKGAGKAPLMLDSVWVDGWPLHTDLPPQSDTWTFLWEPDMQRYILNRHLGFTNAVFLDMSVKKVGIKALWRLKWHRAFDTNHAYNTSSFFSNSFVDKLPDRIE